MLLDKPAGVTSFEALDGVKRTLGTRRVGHAGTLDRFATGLLVVMVGASTRLVRFVQDLEKEYVARLTLGIETDTLDPEGAVVGTAAVPAAAALEAARGSFVGTITQVPPAFSALHIDGRRAHEIARSGGTPQMRPRTVDIRELSLLEYQPPFLDIRIRCSGGTYVRSLARDLAREAGSCAHVSALRRTAIGSIRVEEAVAPGDFLLDPRVAQPGPFVTAHHVLQQVTVRDACLARIRHGRGGPVAELCTDTAPDGEVACLDTAGELIGLGRIEAGVLLGVSAIGGGR